MIKFFSFEPEYFNNNGDQGNLEALKHYLKVELQPAGLPDSDIALFGDASRAALREFGPQLDGLIPELEARLQEGKPTLLVGSTFEYLMPRIQGLPKVERGARISEFRTCQLDGLQVKGYRNTDLVGPDLFVRGAFVGTTLFGPVLAKNLGLLHVFAEALGREVVMSERERSWIAQL